VKEACRFITDTCAMADKSQVDEVWSKHISSKVSLLGWCLLRNRHPSKDNLIQRGILIPTDGMCVAGCNVSETTTHFFLNCNIFGALWSNVWSWWEFLWSLLVNFDITLFSLPGC